MAVPSDGFLEKAHRFRSDVTRFHYRVTGHLQDAEDLTSDTYARLLSLHGMDHLGDRDVRALTFQNAWWVALNYMEARRRKLVDFTSEPPVERLIERHDTPEHRFMGDELAERLGEAIDKLPPVGRKVFELSRFEGLSCDEIAHALGSKRNTVKKHLVRALAHLRSVLFGQGESRD